MFLFQRKKLRGVIAIFEGHFCRRLPEKEAVTFDLENVTRKDTFRALLGVILHAATTSQPDQPIDLSEDMLITVKGVS